MTARRPDWRDALCVIVIMLLVTYAYCTRLEDADTYEMTSMGAPR